MIKLQDYISRYEWDTYRYPTQYIRLKNDNWKKLYQRWTDPETENAKIDEVIPEFESTKSRFAKIKNLVKKNKVIEQTEQPIERKETITLPDTEEELKQFFLNKLFSFQLKWATSTVTHISFVDETYYRDSRLIYLLQRFPDTFLIMYHPIFNIKNAPMESEIILITPVGVEIIYIIEEKPDAVIMAGDERTWSIKYKTGESKMLSPLIALKRTEKVVKSILHSYDIDDFVVKKTVLSKTNAVLFATEPYQTKIIDKDKYKRWFEARRRLSSPLKNRQLKVAELLLRHCKSTSMRRPEWDEGGNPSMFVDLED
ncbi:NERD domain-containing protein [Oceanobacillus zhaokaii]|uniref:NERD domain-containing protein n=1 Tax=Oceanobacillus zhaokaii TaxID=2052660 RepID=UPI001FA9212A|nr:NERD domain-containing protein [Oceanobacillus zhaokaii]